MLDNFSCVRLIATPWTVAHKAPLSMGFLRQEYWSGLPFPSPMHACMLSRFSHVWLCDPTDSSLPGSSIPRILQARILEWVAISFSKACMHAKSLQSCLTLCDPMDSSPPGSSVHRILQARALEWSSIRGHVEFWMKRMASSFLPWSQHTQRATSGSLLCHLSRGHRPRGLGSETVMEGCGEGVLRLSRGEERCDA